MNFSLSDPLALRLLSLSALVIGAAFNLNLAAQAMFPVLSDIEMAGHKGENRDVDDLLAFLKTLTDPRRAR
ncbi:hypothetical protein [Pelagibius sp.]|uniref:hypothetical protein n=1 Tax=Pelagibius sp. TaxID=1931238 RepID=UPI002634B3B7|nr:hypothetical protein [Pelagibius sp.]